MLNIVSILMGLLALVFAVPGFIPLLGILNYIAIPIAAAGAVLGALSSKSTGRNFNLVVLVIAVLRLMLGGGLF